MAMNFKICMLLPFPRYGENMRVPPQVGICSYLTNFGHKVTWVIWADESCQVNSFLFNGVYVHVTPEIQYCPISSLLGRIINRIPNAMKRILCILKIINNGNYNLIFVRDNFFDGLIAAYIKRKYKISFVFALSNPLEQEREWCKIENKRPMALYYLKTRLNEFIVTCLLHEADLIMPISKWLKASLVEQGIPESKIMPLSEGVDLKLFCDEVNSNTCKKYKFYNYKIIIYVGTLGKARCLDVLIQAFSKVRETREDVKLLIVGGGNNEMKLKKLAEELRIREDVTFTGQIPQSEIPDIIAAADIGISSVPPLSFYILSSPIKMFEYMAMAKPVIANKEIPEHRDVLEQSGGGILVQFTPEAIADAIIGLLDNPDEAAEMGQKGQDWVMKNRSYELMARQVENRLLHLLNHS